MGKVQGEGDYEAARRYNERTKEFVDEHADAATKPAGPVDEAALQKARSKSKDDAGQDERDARIFKRASEHPGDSSKQ